jgi:N-acetylmuramoyl-L-alanine amidase
MSGCASAPVKQAWPTYSLHGVTYLPLADLCNAKGIQWDYDTFSRTVTVKKGAHTANFKIGDTLVLFDGSPEHLKDPPDFYQGTIVIPQRLKERIVESFYPGSYAGQLPLVPLRIKKIVIDAGHGGTDPGAMGRSGLKEKDINLDIAKRVTKLLKERGLEIVSTRTSDAFPSLARRVAIANSSGADLFISIHTNANPVRSMKGFEVYYVSNRDDYKRAVFAAKNIPLGLEQYCAGRPSLNLRTILWDMMYASNRAESVTLAHSVCRRISCDLELEVLGIKSANYYVLKGVRMPAILIEIGFISNSAEERLLKDPYYRQQLADGIVKGIEEYASRYACTQENG